MPELHAGDFAAFFRAVHGVSPFPWQARLAAQVAERGRWPRVLDLPTGTGKTAVLDIALFHLALDAGVAARRAPTRTVFVVDRRTIVDQAYERAQRLETALLSAQDGVLATVRDRLSSVGHEGRPLVVAQLRGGIARNEAWARTPDQPLVAISTVDQVGSRLLFRGYGVSEFARSIHAGLLGNDVLYLLDEVHLSAPFRETLAEVADRYRRWADVSLPARFGVVEMSATPGAEQEDRFALGPDDRAHPVLRRRLEARKPARLEEVPATRVLAALEKAARELAARTVLVVVNRVRTARELHGRLARSLEGRADVVLITGRMRPLDREEVEARIRARVASGAETAEGARPFVVVATQCVEAGADLDFDALVTECASLDALRQRFGRLDRLGRLGEARAVVIAPGGRLGGDAVYGDALDATFRWLRDLGQTVDFGISALPVPTSAEALAPLLAPRPRPPVLLPAHLDAWVQTSPAPEPEPDVALFLHGPGRDVADCQVVWRADLDEQTLRAALSDRDAAERVIAAVDIVPPSTGEAAPVPYAAVRRWLEGRDEPPVADVEGVTAEEEDDDRRGDHGEARPALVWRGDESSVVLPGGLRPGDTVVVPSTYGGLQARTWDPGSTEPVPDLGDVAWLRRRGTAILRLHAAVLASSVGKPVPPPVPVDDEESAVDDREVVAAWLEALGPCADWPDALRGVVEALRRDGKRLRVERLPGPYFVVTIRRRVDEVSSEDDGASFTGAEVTLQDHLAGVGERAAEFARRGGLPAEVVQDVRLAGRWHDAGKADPRFQRLLHGGSAFRAEVAEAPLAKSAVPARTRRAREEARRRSGYPGGARHELQSLALLAERREILGRARDPELVLHLVASHHGRCRPLAPFVPDEEPVEVKLPLDGVALAASSAHGLARLDSGVPERFLGLVRRYGYWGLAWLEAMLRLGDHRRSEEEAR